MKNKIKINKKMTIFLILSLIVGIILLIPYKEKEIKYSQEDLHVSNELKIIWEDILVLCENWSTDKITREELANEGYLLYNKYLKLTDDLIENQEYGILDSLKLKTEVMLFDLIRGFDIEDNEYAKKSKIEEETLKYVYNKRYNNFIKDFNSIKD